MPNAIIGSEDIEMSKINKVCVPIDLELGRKTDNQFKKLICKAMINAGKTIKQDKETLLTFTKKPKLRNHSVCVCLCPSMCIHMRVCGVFAILARTVREGHSWQPSQWVNHGCCSPVFLTPSRHRVGLY